MRHHHLRLIIVTVATALFAVPGVASAATAPVAAPPAQVGVVLPDVVPATAAQVTAITTALDAQGVPSVAEPLGGTIRTTYTLPSGSTVVAERPRTMPGTVTPQWSVGVGWGLYIYLNQSDQKVVFAGAAGTLAALICGSTALVGCAIAAGALAAAAQWFADRGGICPKRLQIRIIATFYTMKCVN